MIKTLDEYRAFIEAKTIGVKRSGFDVEPGELNAVLKGHQSDVVRWGVRGGCRAVFASFGLGKTVMQLEMSRIIREKHDGLSLIVCPLGVKQEFTRDAKKVLNADVPLYVKSTAEVKEAAERGVKSFITNYERVRDGDFDVSLFEVVCLDEASVLRSNNTKTWHLFLAKFSIVPSRYVCTATPSPNNYIEIIQYAAFLGIMDIGQAKTRFFQRNSEKAGDLTLLPHKEEEFWTWVSTWAIFLYTPSDLGYSDDGYILPELRVHWHCVKSAPVVKPDRKTKQISAFHNAAASLPDAAKAKNSSIQERLEKAMEIMADDPGEKWLLWHDLENERRAIEKAIPEAVTVYGEQDIDLKESLIIDFSEGKYDILATKPEIAGQGCNFQHHCHKNIFMGITHKFHDIIQAIHRTHRFMQGYPVDVHFIYTESEETIVQSFKRKWKQHDTLVANMRRLIKENGLTENALKQLVRGMGVTRREVAGKHYKIVHNDAVEEAYSLPTDSMDMIVTSFPFAKQYEYTASLNDFGHCETNEHFWQQMEFLIPQMHRVLKPGRICALHAKDRIEPGNFTGKGFPTLYPFSDECVRNMVAGGFAYMGRITIPTDVVRENNQTYRLGWSECCKDGTKMGVGVPEYMLIFRKLPTDTSDGYADTPVSKLKVDYSRARWQVDAHGFWRSSGNHLIGPNQLDRMTLEQILRWWKEDRTKVYDHERHVNIGEYLESKGILPVRFMLLDPSVETDCIWADVVRMRTLNTMQSQKQEANHLCPLPIDIVQRAIRRWSSEGETIYDPFGGLMTVPYVAIGMDRKGFATELNPDYFDYGGKYCFEAEYKREVPTLFDLLEPVNEIEYDSEMIEEEQQAV